MRFHNSASGSSIPVLPLVDILFSAFAAFLATAIIAVAMIRARDPDADRPVLPMFTIVAQADTQDCADSLKIAFRVKPSNGPEVEFSDFSMANNATDTDRGEAGLNAWYFSDSSLDPNGQGGGLCANGACAWGELIVLTASQNTFSVTSSVSAQADCAGVKVALLSGPLPETVDGSALKPADTPQSLSFSVP